MKGERCLVDRIYRATQSVLVIVKEPLEHTLGCNGTGNRISGLSLSRAALCVDPGVFML